MPEHDIVVAQEFSRLVAHVTRLARRQYHEQLEEHRRTITACPSCGRGGIGRDRAWVTDQGWVEVLVCTRCRHQWQEPPYPVFQLRDAIRQTFGPLRRFVIAGSRSGAPPSRWARGGQLRSDPLRAYHAESIAAFLKKHEWVLKDEEERAMLAWPPEYYTAWGCRRLDGAGILRRVLGRLSLPVRPRPPQP